MNWLTYRRSLIPATGRRIGWNVLAVWLVCVICRGADAPVSELPQGAREEGGGAAVAWEPPSAPRRPVTPPPTPAVAAPVATAQLVFGKGDAEPPPAATGAVVAAEAAPATVAVATPVSAVGAAVQGLRDPFWPSDYTPPVLVPALKSGATGARVVIISDVVIQEAEWRACEKELRVAAKNWGRMPDKQGQEKHFVLIHGKTYLVGDTVSLTTGGKTFRWRIVEITRQAGPVFDRILPKAAVSVPQK